MNRYLSATALLGMLIGAAGCDDDFLTTAPQDVISNEVYWQFERDFTLAVNAAYRNLTATDALSFDGVSDIGYSGKDWTRNHAPAMGIQDALNGWSNGLWGGLYQGISRANEVLAQVEATDVLSSEARTSIEAQARFLRGNFYHELLWLYGGVPLFTRIPTIEEARQVSRNTRTEVYDFIIADLQAAAAGLPLSWPDQQRGRATRGAALAYIARTALYEASIQKYGEGDATRAAQLFQVAANAAREVMELGVYELYPDYRGLFTYAGEGSSEVIFDYQIVKGVNGWSAWRWFAPHSMGGDVEFTPTRALVDAYRLTDGLLPAESPLYDPTPPVINNGSTVSLGMYADRDPRFYATVLFPGGAFNGQVYNSYPDSPTSDRLLTNNFGNTHTGYIGLKYVDPSDGSDPTNSGINIIKMRYADVLLMYAEAMIELGNFADPSVADALNQLRDRVGMPHVQFASQEEAIQVVRNERLVELAMEGLRMADIRRWRTAAEVMPGNVGGIDVVDGGQTVTLRGIWQRSFNAPRDYLWPIPAPERDLNQNLAQNPGY